MVDEVIMLGALLINLTNSPAFEPSTDALVCPRLKTNGTYWRHEYLPFIVFNELSMLLAPVDALCHAAPPQLYTSSALSSRAPPQCCPTLRSATIGMSMCTPNLRRIMLTSSIVFLIMGKARAR